VTKLIRTLVFITVSSMPLTGLCVYDEPAIIVTATRSEQERVYIPAAVTVVSREDIIASGAVHIAEVLQGLGGIQLSDLYGDGSRTSIGMRGFGETANANTLVLVDGRRLNNPDLADPDLNSVSLKDVERIEIIQGSGSVLYGDQAVGGVINIITRKPEKFAAEAAIVAGSYGRKTLQAYIANAFDNGIALRVSAESRQADNYRAHNEIEYSNVFARADYSYGGNNVFLEVQSVTDEQQNPGALFRSELESDRRQSVPDFANDFNNVEHRISRAGLEQTLSAHWSLLAEYTDRDTDGEFVLSFRGFPAAPQPANRQDRALQSFTPRLAGRYELANGPLLLTLGADREETDYFLESQLGTQQSNQQTRSGYLQAIVPVLPAADLALGYRGTEVENELIDRPAFGQGVPDDADLDDDISVISAGLTVYASESLRHFIRYEENYRFPKVDEHTNSPVVPFPGESSEPLATQNGESTEVGVDWARDGHHASAVIYRLDLENEISFDPVSFRNVNIDSTRREGITLDAGWQLNTAVSVGINYSHLDTEIRTGGFAGNKVPFTAGNMAGINLDWLPHERWHLYTELQHTGDRLFPGDFAAELPELEGYTVANAQLDFRTGGWKLSLRVNNIADKVYSGSGAAAAVFGPPPFFIPMTVESFYPAPERNYWLQFSYRTE
jgi:iron complex outermembrane recepter protein